MIELLQITNDPDLARRCDALGGFRLFVDLERNGKAQRQAERNTHISAHQASDISAVKAVLQCSPLMVRLNPLWEGSAGEVQDAIARGADWLMLPLFQNAATLRSFIALVAGRARVSALMEHIDAYNCLSEWVSLPGLDEVFVGLNDLHLSMGLSFMFEPLATGMVDAVATAAHAAGKRFGFGGIARMDEGELAGRAVLAEHVRLGSGAVIVSRTFLGPARDLAPGAGGFDGDAFESAVADLRAAQVQLELRSPAEQVRQQAATAAVIRGLALRMAAGRAGAEAASAGQAAPSAAAPSPAANSNSTAASPTPANSTQDCA